MATAIIPIIVAFVGLLMYGFCTNAKLGRIGEILFFVGVFWLVNMMSGKSVHFGGLDKVPQALVASRV